MQVSLPHDLYDEVKSRSLAASELLQAAVRAEVDRLDELVALDEYLAELRAEFGEPTPEEWAEAEAFAAPLFGTDATRRAG